MPEGFIYILVNPSMKQNIVKIGKTCRTPEERAKEISSNTGVATPFEVAFQIEVHDCDMLELLIHQELNDYRVNIDREFFEISPDKARSIIAAIVALDLKNRIAEDKKRLKNLLEHVHDEDLFNFKVKTNSSNPVFMIQTAEKYYGYSIKDKDNGDYKSAYNYMKKAADVLMGTYEE